MMRNPFQSIIYFVVISVLSAPGMALAQAEEALAEGTHDGPGTRFVICSEDTLSHALQTPGPLTEIVFTGTCVEEELVITRDGLTLRGAGEGATLEGLITVSGAQNVTIRDFLIQGNLDLPIRTDLGGVNAINSAGVTIENIVVQDPHARGIRGVGSTLTIRNSTIRNAQGGAFVFRGSAVILDGSILTEECLFGMSLVNSTGFARRAELTFNDGFLGLVVQINSGLEQVEGRISANRNVFGVFIASQGSVAYGAAIEGRENMAVGMVIDELSNLTPLIGAPGAGPSVTMVDNGVLGISVERDSDLELVMPATVTGNGLGVFVDNSLLRVSGSTINDNAGPDVALEFGSRATFNGDNDISSVACDDTVITRGDMACGAALTSSGAVLTYSAAPSVLEGWTRNQDFFEGVMRTLVQKYR